MKTKFIHISFYDERETNDRSLTTLNLKTKKKIWKEKKKSIEKMIFLRVRLVYMLYIYTYIHTWYLLLYIYEVILSIIHHLSKENPSEFFFLFSPSTKSQRGKERKGKGEKKGKKKGKKKEEILFISYLPYLGTLVFSFFFFQKIYWYTGTCRYLPTLYPAYTYLPFFR